MQSIDNLVVDEVENFVRTEVPSLIEDLYDPKLENNELKYFFGHFVKKPSSFIFVPGEKILILGIIAEIKRIVAEKGFAFFSCNKDTHIEANEDYFKSVDVFHEKIQANSNRRESVKMNLFNKVSVTVKTYNKEHNPEPIEDLSVTPDMVDVSVNGKDVSELLLLFARRYRFEL